MLCSTIPISSNANMKKTKTKTKRAKDVHAKRLFNFWIYFFAVTTPLFELTQAVHIYQHQSSADVSIYTWLYLIASNSIWLLYGYYYKLKPIILMYTLYTIIELIVVAMIIIYR